MAYNLTHISFIDNLKRTFVSKKEKPQSVFSGKVTFIFPLFVCLKRRSDIENIFFNKHKIRVQPEKDGIHYNVVTHRTIKLFLKQLLFFCCSSLGFFESNSHYVIFIYNLFLSPIDYSLFTNTSRDISHIEKQRPKKPSEMTGWTITF